ncbi:hypothetical protein IAD21_00933 [Abditibacteriota bacterium]|nr:hypothetical protein IAD21_00933 [Abditibacteriota bacterium]
MKPHSIEPHDLLVVTGFSGDYFYRVTGVFLGALNQTSVITLEALDESAPHFHEDSRTMAVPLLLIEAGLNTGLFTHYKRGPFPLS